SWNALMIHAMARAGRAFGRQDWIDSARRALDFVRTQLWRKRRLLATYKDGKGHLNAYLDDHVFLLAALLEMMQTHYRAEDMQMARELADAVLDRFEDRASGGFFFTSSDHEQLIHRPKPGPDNATPSGNGVAALMLQRLGHLIGEPRYLESAERALRLFFPEMQRHASAYASLCAALSEYIDPAAVAILRGNDTLLDDFLRALAKHYFPATVAIALPDAQAGLPVAMNKPQRPGVNAWVCRGVNCLPPIQDPAELAKILANGK
ncbi:MAG: thioredoxin domain-containing protein, partial [Betaproteobacteria bacterium]